MHSHAERGNENPGGFSRSHALRGNACCDALRRVSYTTISYHELIFLIHTIILHN